MKSSLLLIGLLLLLVPSVCAQKPEPPAGLVSIFSEVIAIEDAVDEGDWLLAQTAGSKVDELLESIAASVNSAAGPQNYQVLKDVVVYLRAALQQEEKTTVSERLIHLQQALFQAMESYHYRVHPAFSLLREFVAVAIEAAGRSEFDRVMHEMKEVAYITVSSAELMGKSGIGKGMQKDFRDILVEVMVAAKERNQAMATAALLKMEKLAGAFAWMGSQQ